VPGRRRAGAAREEGEEDWGGRRWKKDLTGGPHLSAGGSEREGRWAGGCGWAGKVGWAAGKKKRE
jgi:hypothetical protein